MAQPVKLLILSDVHYASAAEKARGKYELAVIKGAFAKSIAHFYRHYIWLRDPFAQNHLLERILNHHEQVDWCIAGGDYSCDSAFIGIADDAALQSARECLGKLRAHFGERFRAVAGDHEFGKISLMGGAGGLRFESWRRLPRLGIEPFWTVEIGKYLLVGVTSTLLALPAYEPETLLAEFPLWREQREAHIRAIRGAFEQVRADTKLLLFCHDPTALPFLAQISEVAERIPQIERTIIGHLHTELVLRQALVLAGIPNIRFCGNAVRRMSAGLNRARCWKKFRVMLCPSPSGSELLKDGGYYTVYLDPQAGQPAQFALHRIHR